jgi:hypothetical protein
MNERIFKLSCVFSIRIPFRHNYSLVERILNMQINQITTGHYKTFQDVESKEDAIASLN